METLLRKLGSREIARAAEVFSEMFKDYSAYSEILAPERMEKGRRALFLYEVFAASPFTYVAGEFEGIASVKRPGDKERGGFFLSPCRSIEFLSSVGREGIKKAAEYSRFAAEVSARHYRPDTDCYVKNIGVAESARGKGLLRAMLGELTEGMPVYLETHDEDNVAIYRHLGFELVETARFGGAYHFAMRREK